MLLTWVHQKRNVTCVRPFTSPVSDTTRLFFRDFRGKFEGMTAVVKFTENNGCLYVFVYMWQTSVHNLFWTDCRWRCCSFYVIKSPFGRWRCQRNSRPLSVINRDWARKSCYQLISWKVLNMSRNFGSNLGQLHFKIVLLGEGCVGKTSLGKFKIDILNDILRGLIWMTSPQICRR